MLRLLVLTALVVLAAAIPPRVPMLDGRIVGGKETAIEIYPHQISLQYFNRHICGGSIISSNVVVTAAHCTDGSSADDLSVLAGTTYRTSGGVIVSVSRIIQHESYNSRSIDYDISLLILASNLSLGIGIQPIKLAEDEGSPGATVAVTGWGALTEGGSLSNTLQVVEVDTVSRQECSDAYGAGTITDRMVCAGGKGGKDSCQGDSGGPMKLVSSGTQLGIVSWGYGCARPDYPGVYASVPALRSWIRDHTGI